MDASEAEYQLGRHAERRFIMALIGAVRHRMNVQPNSEVGVVLDSLVMEIASASLPDIRDIAEARSAGA